MPRWRSIRGSIRRGSASRVSSYGGQLTNWLVTQTDRFKAAVPAASISNLVSHNYMSVYHDYLEQEYGTKPHMGGVVEMLWERSAIRFATG